MKIVKILLLCFYLIFVIPTIAVIIGGLCYGIVVESIKSYKK
jgi:hypothetical protein